MIISHVKIIAFQTIIIYCLCRYGYFILLEKTVVDIINRTIHMCLEIPDLFLVLNMISHSFTALTREIGGDEEVFPRTHVLFSMCIPSFNYPLGNSTR